MLFKTNTSPFFSSKNNVSKVMQQVLLALVPGTLIMIYFFGWGIFFNVLLSVSFAIGLEALALKIRKRPVMTFLNDYSALVTGWLFALTLPPLVPWWVLFVGVFFAIIIAKQLYGGLGYNPFNPAMVGFAVLIISFPLEMGLWLEASSFGEQTYGFIDSLQIVFGLIDTAPDWDAITMATPLDAVKTGILTGSQYHDIIVNSHYLSSTTSNVWMWGNLAFLCGGLWLLYKKVIHWQIPVSLLVTLTVIATFFHFYSPTDYVNPMLYLLSGSTMLGAFFIATDPVSASTTPTGKLIYGAFIGLFIYVIRAWGSYPDSMAFSILIMNMAVPVIDYYTQPRVFGHGSLKKKGG